MHAIWFELLKKWIPSSEFVFRKLLAFSPLSGEKVEEEGKRRKANIIITLLQHQQE